MRSTDLFAAQTDKGFRHFYPSIRLVAFCYDAGNMPLIAPVRVVEDPTGTHFAWWEEERGHFSMVYHSRMLVEMCSPDAFKSAEAKGEGQLLQVPRVEPGREFSNQGQKKTRPEPGLVQRSSTRTWARPHGRGSNTPTPA